MVWNTFADRIVKFAVSVFRIDVPKSAENFCTAVEDSTLLRNVGIFIPDYTTLFPKDGYLCTHLLLTATSLGNVELELNI